MCHWQAQASERLKYLASQNRAEFLYTGTITNKTIHIRIRATSCCLSLNKLPEILEIDDPLRCLVPRHGVTSNSASQFNFLQIHYPMLMDLFNLCVCIKPGSGRNLQKIFATNYTN